MSLIEVNNLKYRYPHSDKLALDSLNFTVEKGQFIGIAGANKAGKSTLCQVFAGLVPTMFKGAYGGSVVVGGKNTAQTPIAEICQSVGLIFQNPFNQLSGARETVFEEVAFGLQNLGVPKEEIIQRVRKSLQLLDIAGYSEMNPFDLSGGQTQRVAIASILAMEPEIIVLDEPTSQLDPQGSEEVFRVVDKLAGSGITVIMVEHKIEKLAAYCDKILLLHEGRQIAFDTPAQIFSRSDLENFGVEPPVYTAVCRVFGVAVGENDDQPVYPVTLAEVEASKDKFPAVVSGAVPTVANQGQSESLYRINGLSFQYNGGQPVIDGLNLVLDQRPTAIIGQNGAGKTTLVKLLKGLLKPVAGEILFEEADIARRTVAQLAGQVGYVFQNPDDQIFKNRVLDEVMVGPLNIGMDKAAAEQRARAALKMVAMEAAADENPYDLDLAERKMIAIASVISMDTKVLILDEPTIAQDIRGRAVIGRIVRELSAAGKLVIAILHDMDFVAEYFTRVIVMAHGRVLTDGPCAEVFYRKEVLAEARLEQPHVTSFCQMLGYEGVFMTAADIKTSLAGQSVDQ